LPDADRAVRSSTRSTRNVYLTAHDMRSRAAVTAHHVRSPHTTQGAPRAHQRRTTCAEGAHHMRPIRQLNRPKIKITALAARDAYPTTRIRG
jgi:hypothetical protein